MKHFIDWLYGTPLSHLIQTVRCIIPITQSIHIMCIALLFTSMMMLDLRLLGVAGTQNSVESYSNRFLPWLWAILPVLLFTGLIMIIAEPNRDLQNVAFYVKMTLLLVASGLSFAFQRSLRTDPAAWEQAGERKRLGQVVGSVSLLCWVGIIISGRLIAYV